MQIPIASAFVWAVMIASIVVLYVVVRGLGRRGVYWVVNWFAIVPGSGVFLLAVWLWAQSANRVLVKTTFGTLAVILLASGLFYVKIAALRLYAIVELMFALVMALKGIRDLRSDVLSPDMLAIGSSAYLIIRGLDDLKKDFDERRSRHKQAGAMIYPAATFSR